MKSRCSLAFLLLLWLTALLFPALATAAEPNEATQAVSTKDTDIAVDDLKLILLPLTQSELKTEVVAWQMLVKTSVQAISDTRLATHETNDKIDAAEAKQEDAIDTGDIENQKADLLKKQADLENVKMAVLKRFNMVLDAYEEKGGDPAIYRSYSKAVSGIKIETGDVSSTLAAVTGWLKSEEGGYKLGISAIKFCVIILVFWLLSGIGSRLTARITDNHLNWSKLLERFLKKIVKRSILLIGLLVALSTVGVNIGSLLALIGGGAFIVGFALQDTLGNFAAGLMLLVYRPFDVGNVVEIGGVSGKVEHVSLVSTTIKTFDNKVVLVPNKKVWGEVITNATSSGERRVDMMFGIGYEDDISKTMKVLEKIVAEHEKVLETPATVIKLHELADSSVNFICRPWTKTSDYWDVYWDITRAVKEEFDAAKISIPYPQQDVHLHQGDAPPVIQESRPTPKSGNRESSGQLMEEQCAPPNDDSDVLD